MWSIRPAQCHPRSWHPETSTLEELETNGELMLEKRQAASRFGVWRRHTPPEDAMSRRIVHRETV